MTSLPLPNLATCTRQQVLDYFDNSWTLTEVLFSALQGRTPFYHKVYHQLRHPLIFYYAHPAVLYVNKCRVAGLLDKPVNYDFEHFFEVGVDEMNWDDLSQDTLEWPPIEAVTAYRKAVYNTVRRILTTHEGLADGHPQIQWGDPLWALFMGFEHERIHLETSSVLMREAPLNWVRPPALWPLAHPSAADGQSHRPTNAWIAVAEGNVAVGKPLEWPSYGWDNEYGRREVSVRPFAATKNLISNAEFHEFVADGGYAEEDNWTREGWAWRRFRNAKWPTYWVQDGPAGLHQYKLRAVFEVVDLPLSWPVEVNFHEAVAYAQWRARRDGADAPYRLLTEAEHHQLRGAPTLGNKPPYLVDADPVMASSGADFGARGVNLNLAYGSASPVDASPATDAGFRDVSGNVWQWCEDHFNPLPTFEPHPFYDDFSSPCYDGKHQMILGGSFASTGDEASVFARFHFRPHFFQHAGFRLARSKDGDNTCDAVRLDNSDSAQGAYENEIALGQYLLLHYGGAGELEGDLPIPTEANGFPERCARLVIEEATRLGVDTKRALDLGCAVGGSTFVLSELFDDVLGIDLSQQFVQTATKLKLERHLPYQIRLEGALTRAAVAELPEAARPERVAFAQADACALPAHMANFDAILMANLIDRLPSPKACLGRLTGPRGLLAVGGLLVITSPYTWLERFTPRSVWIGGYERGGKTVRGLDGLKGLLGDDIKFLSSRNLPLIIREHARKYEYIVSQASVWQRVR